MNTFRSVPVDGGLLLFERRRGLNLRIATDATRHLRQLAPRTVMFGITNACNLDCSFCSRDHSAASSWTVDSAFALLSDLSAQGVLEVAFGGGEPLTFRGFDALLERLAAHTDLALNVTTNGTLLTPERAARISPWVSEVRVSIYDDNPWEAALRQLAQAGVSSGANVIVTRSGLPTLPALMERIRAAGCHDIALLRYVGPDATEELSAAEDATLADHIARAPIRVRVSTCFGDRLHAVPRLFERDDCGAGEDFVVVTSDRRTKACSFQRATQPFHDVTSLLAPWRQRRAARERAPYMGCARPFLGASTSLDGVHVWQAFSSNNSGDCVLVGRFDDPEKAASFVEPLKAAQNEGGDFPPSLTAQLSTRGISVGGDELLPRMIENVGRNVLLHTFSAIDDDFPSLRTLLWKLGGVALSHGIHVHDPLRLVTALGFDDRDQLDVCDVTLTVDGFTCASRGMTLFVEHEWQALAEVKKYGARIAAEIVPANESMLEYLKGTPSPPETEWLFATFPAEATAATLRLSGATVAGRWVLMRRQHVTSRDGYVLHRAGGRAVMLPGDALRFELAFWQPDRGRPLDIDALQSDLRVELGSGTCREVHLREEYVAARGGFVTTDPARALEVVVDFARGRSLELSIDITAARPLAEALRRLELDVSRP